MDKVTKTYNLLMEGFNSQQKAIWQNKLKQYPQFCNVDEDIWDKYVSCWSAQNWQYQDEQIEALTEDQMWNLWHKFMSSPTNYIMFFMGITEPQRVQELYYVVRDQMAQEEQEEHYKHTVNESCFDDGTYDELYEWYDQELVSAVLDMLSHNDLFYPPRTVARLLEDKDILEVYNEGRLSDLTEKYINWKINPRYYSSYGLKKFKNNK